MNLARLKQRYNSIRDSSSCHVTDDKYMQFESHKQILTTMAAVENRSIAVYDFNKKIFLMKEEANVKLLGYNPDEADYDNIDKYHEKVHPEDIEFLYETEIMAHEFFHSFPGEERKNYKLSYDFRVRKKDGKYVRFMHQLLVLECDDFGNSWLLLIITDLISESEISRSPRRYVMNIKTKHISFFENGSAGKSQLLTKRELEILILLAQGLDSGAISQKLFISINTVNNHRQNILSKTGTVNTMQTILFAKRIGMI